MGEVHFSILEVSVGLTWGMGLSARAVRTGARRNKAEEGLTKAKGA